MRGTDAYSPQRGTRARETAKFTETPSSDFRKQGWSSLPTPVDPFERVALDLVDTSPHLRFTAVLYNPSIVFARALS